VHAGVNFLRAFEDLIHVEMLLGVVHDLQDDAALARHANPARGYGLLEPSCGLRGVEALGGGSAVGWTSCHEKDLDSNGEGNSPTKGTSLAGWRA
jgi:hypothetical protein